MVLVAERRVLTELSESGEHRYLSTGAIVGGQRPSARSWSETYKDWAQALKMASGDKDGPLSVSLVFLVPGEFLAPDFTEPKITAFRRKTQQIEVQIPVPDAPPQMPFDYLTLAALDALNVIEEWARKRKRADDVQLARKVVSSVTPIS
jgi:hypothetical protein